MVTSPNAAMRDFWCVFDRVPYGHPKTARILHEHGYPFVQCDPTTDILVACHAHLMDEAGSRKYAFAEGKFFFLTEDDAHLFRSLLLLI